MTAAEYETHLPGYSALCVGWDQRAGIATVTLSQASEGNRVTAAMCEDLRRAWRWIRDEDAVRAAVVLADGSDFSLGAADDLPRDPGLFLGPKRNRVWKPVLCAVHGRVQGPALHIVNASDIVIAANTATFVDGELSHGRMSAVVPIGLAERLPIGEVMRLVLLGADDPLTAARAHQLGLVSEVVTESDLTSRAQQLAARLAEKAPTAVQGTVRAIWESQQMPPWIAQAIGGHYVNLGNERSMREVDSSLFESGHRPKWDLR